MLIADVDNTCKAYEGILNANQDSFMGGLNCGNTCSLLISMDWMIKLAKYELLPDRVRMHF
jgi:hypothetical protein